MLLKKPKFKMPKLLQGSAAKTRVLNQTELDRLALELDAIRAETLADLNEKMPNIFAKLCHPCVIAPWLVVVYYF